MTQNSSESRTGSILSVTIVMMIIPIIAVLLRFWSRAIILKKEGSRKYRFWWDDWFALATLPFIVIQHAAGIYWTKIGLGKHMAEVSPGNIKDGLLLLFVTYNFYDTAISLPKLSALAFYARVFTQRGSNRVFRKVLWATAALVIAWWIFAVLSNIFQCTPVKKAWMPTIPEGHCLNTWKWWLGSAISSVIIDLIILIVPLPSLWKLQLKLSHKVLITGVFICGYCVIVTSIGRLVAVSKAGNSLEEDLTYNVVPVAYWLALEAPISIVGVCLPSIFSLIKRGVEYGPTSLLTSKEVSLLRSEGSGNGPLWSFARNRDTTTDKSTIQNEQSQEHLNDSYQAKASYAGAERHYTDTYEMGKNISQNQIVIKKDVKISRGAVF